MIVVERTKTFHTIILTATVKNPPRNSDAAKGSYRMRHMSPQNNDSYFLRAALRRFVGVYDFKPLRLGTRNILRLATAILTRNLNRRYPIHNDLLFLNNCNLRPRCPDALTHQELGCKKQPHQSSAPQRGLRHTPKTSCARANSINLPYGDLIPFRVQHTPRGMQLQCTYTSITAPEGR